jgi:dipeptidyl aminopeptidase/acylaminoacyl peptidase
MNADERAREDSGEEDPKPADKLEGKQRKERKDQDESKRWDPRVVQRIPFRSGTSFLSDRLNQVYVMPITEGLEKSESKPRRLTSVGADHNPPQWTADGQFILTARMSDPTRDEPWRWSNLFKIQVSDGSQELLTDDSYSSNNPLPSPDGKWIAFIRFPRERLSQRITRLALISISGGEIRDLNLDLNRSAGDFKWLPDSSGLLFAVLDHGDIEIYRLILVTGQIEKVVAGRMHIENLDVHPQAGIAFSGSTPANPSELFIHDSNGSRQITQVNQKYLDSVIVRETHELRWTSPSGREIQGWYVLPADYVSGKTYPLLLNIHGGPHIMWGPGMKSMWHEWQLQAARGYIAFYCNPTGADGYGEEFQMALYGQWGPLAMIDIMAGVDALVARGFVDTRRLTLTGGSYGGYMTAWITAHSDRFVAAAGHRGVYNLLSFTGTTDIPSFTQNEMGVEVWENPTFLWENSPLAHAHKIKTPFLIIHSENDYRVPISEGEQLFSYIRRSGGTVKFVRFPRDGHEMTRAGEPEHRVSSLTHVLDWFDTYCYPNGSSA